MYSPQLNSPRRDDNGLPSKYGSEIYSSSLKTDNKKHNSTLNSDYYYNKENELHSKKNETEATLLPPRTEKYSTSYVSKSYADNYGSRTTPISSPIHVTAFLKLS